jgi:hypothetical protein
MRMRATVIQDETGKVVAVRIFDVSDRELQRGRIDIDLEVHTDRHRGSQASDYVRGRVQVLRMEGVE